MKIILVGDKLFNADGQTNMTKLIVPFFNFAKASNNLHCNPVRQISFSSDDEN